MALASHDDRTEAEIAENAADGIRISEFPVTMGPRARRKAAGMEVIAGAPEHRPRRLAFRQCRGRRPGLAPAAVDALASDYVPASLVEAAFLCAADTGIALPEAVALVTDRPARMARPRRPRPARARVARRPGAGAAA